MATRFVIIGGGPAGNQAATHAARLGAEVSIIERDVLGGAAHLWDCIPSKAMIATGGAMAFVNRISGMGLDATKGHVDFASLHARISGIVSGLEASVAELLESQGVEILRGVGRMKSPHEVVVETADGVKELYADAVLLATGSRPRIPDWAEVDRVRVLSTRDAYPPPELPEHLIVVGSGVTGVEFVHMFASLGSKVTLIVSRQQVLPRKDPEAIKYDTISYDEVLTRSLAVADAAAFSLCRENNLPIVVFDLMTNGNIGRAVRGEVIGTLVA